MRISPINLAKRVERWQKRLAPLGLGHWRIDRVVLCDETPSESSKANASVYAAQHYDVVSFWFTYDFIESADSRRLDEVIVHEWLHVFMRDSDEAARQVKAWMPERTYEDWVDRMEHEYEGVIDRLARYLVDLHHASKA